MLTYSQNFEDVILARLFCEQKTGFYIDVGACHPEALSVTKHFYDLGWRGINIEPIPSLINLFNKSRPRDINLNVAIDVSDGKRLFYEAEDFDALSTFDPEQAEFLRSTGHQLSEYFVDTVSLNYVFEKFGCDSVDFLKIDVEGSEESVLRSLDLAKHRPRVLVIEAMQPAREFPGWGNHRQVSNWPWEDLVTSNGYIFAYFDGISRFYVRSEDKALLPRFELPPGCFDSIHRPEEYYLTQELQTKTQELQTKTQELLAKTQEVHVAYEQITTLRQEIAYYKNLGARDRFAFFLSYVKIRSKQILRDRFMQMLDIKDKPAKELPKITVVTPAFNCRDYIAETIESVLSQDYPCIEYIIVDGRSTDGTLDIIKSYAERQDFRHQITHVISEADEGMYDALSKGFRRATGEILCYLNADDLFECGGLRSVGQYFADNPKAFVIYHEDIVLIDGWKYPNRMQPSNICTFDLLSGHILFQDGIFWRKSAYEAVGGFRRDLRLAGDFDLWLRLSDRYKFIKRPGHVSCFRVSDNQLSKNLSAYNEEMGDSVKSFILAKNIISRRLLRLGTRLLPLVRRVVRPYQDRLFFPFNESDAPASHARVVKTNSQTPKSPIDGRPVERLLFSTPDTRFGERDINYIYYDSRNRIAVSDPPVAPEELDSLYKRYYSNPPSEMVEATGNSPYIGYNRMSPWEKIILHAPIEYIERLLPNSWIDNTLSELQQILEASKVDTTYPLRVLDAGCFEGHLLSQIRENTCWAGFGIEPNDEAVRLAKEKGHHVWHGHAENAAEIIPCDQQFDVIYMGQSIEHVNDPVHVLRRLRLLLAPGGALVMSTPNLDSRQIDWFGPTWAHWHLPYHRYIFSRTGLQALAHQAGLLPIRFMSFSHPYWTTMSVAQNWLGLGGSASHAVDFNRKFVVRAQRISLLNRLIWNRLGKGDYCFILLKDGSND